MEKHVPLKFRSIFDFEHLNSIQSALCEEIFTTERSLVLSAPTGCGKTVIFELSIIKYLQVCELCGPDPLSCIIYIAPLKSLCNEKFSSWTRKFRGTMLNCTICTGDNETLYFDEITNQTLLITTPEKLDAFMKSSGEWDLLFKRIKYCFVDEVHIIKDPCRGPILECLLTAVKRISCPRFICVSATMSNAEDLAAWLCTPSTPALFYNFGDEFRQSAIKKLVFGYYKPKNQSIFQFDSILNHKISDIVNSFSNGKPVLIFCTTRRGTAQLARELVRRNEFPVYHSHRIQYAEKLKDPHLKICFSRGVGYHHAGLAPEDRRLIEQAFTSGCLPILASTSTLSMGLNLPAHLVIIKNTEQLVNGEVRGYTSTQILQMVGRAGRPQFDTEGIAIIMTSAELKAHYESVLLQSDTIESCLHTKLAEHINTEISLGRVETLSDVTEWFKSTFLCVRMKKLPQRYGLLETRSIDSFNGQISDICFKEVLTLERLGLLTLGEDTDVIHKRELCHLMMKNHLELATIEMMWGLSGEESLEQLLHFVAGCPELRDIPLRNNEKTLLNSLNHTRGRQALRFPLAGRIATVPMKIVCLLQCQLTGMQMKDYSLLQDTDKIKRCAKRIVNALVSLLWLDSKEKRDPVEHDTVSENKESNFEVNGTHAGEQTSNQCFPKASSNYSFALNSLEFKKTLQVGCWLNRPLASLLTSPHMTQEDLDKLVVANLMTLSKVEMMSSRELEVIVGKPAPFGLQLLEYVSSIPKYVLDVAVLPPCLGETIVLQVTVGVARPCSSDTAILLIGDSRNHLLGKYFFNFSTNSNSSFKTLLNLPRKSEDEVLSIAVISTNFVGVDLYTKFPLNCQPGNVLLPNKFLSLVSEAYVTPVMPEISIGFVDKSPNCIEEKSIHFGKRVKWPVVPSDTIQEAISNSKKMKKMPSSTFKGGLTKSTPKNKATRSLTLGSSNEDPKSTFTWTPATAPRVPLIQTSMLDYMKNSSQQIPNSGTPQSSRLVQTAPEYQKNCIRQSTNTVSTHGPAEQPTLKQKRFRWTPISSSTPATQILRSCVPTDTENPIDVESAREQVGEYASRTADDSILESEAKYGSDSGLVQTPRPFNEIALAVTKTKNKCDSAVSDRAEVICTPQDSFNGEEKVNDVWFSHNDSTAAHPEMNFEEGFLEWERETQTPPLTQQRPHWEQKDRSTDIDQDRTRSDSADSCADAFCRSEMKVKSTNPLPLSWKTRVDFTDVSLRPEMNRYTTATASTNTSRRRSYETPPGPPRFRFDVTQKGSADTIGQNVTTSGIDRERSIPDTPCNQSTLVHSVYESKIPENVRFRSTLTRRADGDQNQRLDLDVGLIESGWEELACWIYVMEVCKIHEDNRTISEMTEHTPRLETPSSTTRIMNWQTLSGRIGVDKVQHFQVDCSREDALALKSNGIQVDMDERPSYPEACEE